MPWILDGNNLAQGGARGRVREAALHLARGQRIRLVVFFDGAPPPGGSEVESLGQVEVRYVPNADIAILETLASAGGEGWRVVTDDQDLAWRAQQWGAEVVDREAFWAQVGSRSHGPDKRSEPTPQWRKELEFFRDPRNRLAAGPQRIIRRRRVARRAP